MNREKGDPHAVGGLVFKKIPTFVLLGLIGVLIVVGCGRTPTVSQEKTETAYDPSRDPWVNPSSPYDIVYCGFVV